MKVKFSLYERVAGLFVVTAFLLSLIGLVGIGFTNGWFEKKLPLKTYVDSADGLRPGTIVQLAGIEIGEIKEIDLQVNQKVEIQFTVLARFTNQIRSDSRIRVVRPFIIGEKVLEVDPGEPTAPALNPNQALVAENAPDFLEFLGGNKLGSYMETIDGTMKNVQKLAEAFLSDDRTNDIIELFDKMLPLMDELSVMSREMGRLTKNLNREDKFEQTVVQFRQLAQNMNKDLPKIMGDIPELASNVNLLTKNMNTLIGDMQRMIPVIEKLGPDIPGASKTIIETLNETVITLKAMQKTFFLRASVRKVLEEEAEKASVRKPASGDLQKPDNSTKKTGEN